MHWQERKIWDYSVFHYILRYVIYMVELKIISVLFTNFILQSKVQAHDEISLIKYSVPFEISSKITSVSTRSMLEGITRDKL